MTTMSPHLTFDLHDASQVGEVRRAAVRCAEMEGFDEVACGRVALVATELGTNLVRHARQGQMLVGRVPGQHGLALELLAWDRGPGMADWRACMADGYSTGGTSGTGLGAVRRLSDEFDVYSTVPGGSVILARLYNTAHHGRTGVAETGIAFAGVSVPAPGETVCGDGWSVKLEANRAAVFMADGLGHGPDAADAARAGVEVFEPDAFGAPSSVLDRMHARLRSTRGAAVFMAQLHAAESEIVYGGVGNIAGRVISGVEDRSLMSQHGTAGLQIRKLVDTRQAWPAHALMVLHSDGLTTRWRLDDAPGLLQRHPALIAAWLMREHRRGRDDATVVVLKRQVS